MKSTTISILLILLSFTGICQRFALIDTHTRLPILYTDSISVQQLKQGYFPVEKGTIDSFLANIKYMSNLYEFKGRTKMTSFELRNGITTIKVERAPFERGDRFIINGETKWGEVTSVYNFANKVTSNKENHKRFEKLINYITGNQSLYSGYKFIQPRVYNMYVVKTND